MRIHVLIAALLATLESVAGGPAQAARDLSLSGGDTGLLEDGRFEVAGVQLSLDDDLEMKLAEKLHLGLSARPDSPVYETSSGGADNPMTADQNPWFFAVGLALEF